MRAQSRAQQTSSLLLLGCSELARDGPSSSIEERFALQPDCCAVFIFQEYSVLRCPQVLTRPGTPPELYHPCVGPPHSTGALQTKNECS